MMSNIIWEVCGWRGWPLRYVVHIVLQLGELEKKKKSLISKKKKKKELPRAQMMFDCYQHCLGP